MKEDNQDTDRKKGGRPPKSSVSRKSKTIGVCFSEPELYAIRHRAAKANLPFSIYCHDGVAKEYMQAMGIENTQYIIVRHNNTAHPHLHIVFNRVDNDGKTISDRNDQYRNEKVCKQIKNKYNLTYGKGKENVNVRKLKGAEQTKYEIYHTVKDILPKVRNWQQFEKVLGKQGILIEYKLRGQSDEVQGVSFRKGEHCFKGSDIDRKFSYSKLDAILNKNYYVQEQLQETIPKGTGSSPVENIASGVSEVLSGIGSLFEVQLSDYDPNEAECQRQQALNRKKKPKKRRGFRL